MAETCGVIVDEHGQLCGRAIVAGGLCQGHYQQRRRYGAPLAGRPLARQQRYRGPRGGTCRCCGEPYDRPGGHGLRHSCYMAWWREGQPEVYKGISIYDETGDEPEGEADDGAADLNRARAVTAGA